jgi:uncharacterized LabA/DUF88 family protein
LKQIDKIAVFIDGANLYTTVKSLGFEIDYKRLLNEFRSRGSLLRAFYYTAVFEDNEHPSLQPLLDWLDYNGFTVVTKAAKEFVDQTGRRKIRGNIDVELAIDAMLERRASTKNNENQRACVIEILSCILETRAPSLKSASP